MISQNIMNQILDIRKNWIPERAGIPATRPVEAPSGIKRVIPLADRELTIYIHKPNTKKIKYPVYFNFHGGGMCAGSAAIDEFLCKEISKRSECIVVNLDYRLAPEYPFPLGLNDAYETILYFVENAEEFDVDATRIVMGGQSAGGNLAAACSIKANRSKDFQYNGIVLCYAGLDFGPKEDEKAIPGAIPKKTGALYAACYAMGGGDMKDPLASPLYACKQDVEDTPCALIISAELDTLRLDSENYGRKLIHAGVPVIYREFLNCVHGFTHREYEKEPKQVMEYITRYLKSIWNT